MRMRDVGAEAQRERERATGPRPNFTLAVVLADALTLENSAAALTFHSTHFPPLPARPAA